MINQVERFAEFVYSENSVRIEGFLDGLWKGMPLRTKIYELDRLTSPMGAVCAVAAACFTGMVGAKTCLNLPVIIATSGMVGGTCYMIVSTMYMTMMSRYLENRKTLLQ